jgi:hypothetical protein
MKCASCIPNAVESTEVVPFVSCVSPYFRTRYGSWEGVVNETQPGEARASPGWVVVRGLLKWGEVRSLEQRLVEREAWVSGLGLAWSLRSPVRENHAKISTVDDAVAIEVSAAREAVA